MTAQEIRLKCNFSDKKVKLRLLIKTEFSNLK